MTETTSPDPIEVLAQTLHQAYETLAPDFGYVTCEETREFNPTTPNGMLMLAVVRRLADTGKILVPGYHSKNVFPWFFQESPDQITANLIEAMATFGHLLPAVRHVFIENPPEVALTARGEIPKVKPPVMLKRDIVKPVLDPKPAMFQHADTAITIHVTGPNASGRSLVAAHIANALAHHHDVVRVRTVEGGMQERLEHVSAVGKKGPFKIIAPAIEVIDFCAHTAEEVAVPVTLSRVETHQMTNSADMRHLDEVGRAADDSTRASEETVGENQVNFRLADGNHISAREVSQGLIYFLGVPHVAEILRTHETPKDRLRTLGLVAELIYSMKTELERITRPGADSIFVGENHPRYRDWHEAVHNGDTLLGLKDWLEHNPEESDYDLFTNPVCNQAITITLGEDNRTPADHAAAEAFVSKWLMEEGNGTAFLTIQPYVEGRSGKKTKIDVFAEIQYSVEGVLSNHNVEFTHYGEIEDALEERTKRLSWHFASAIRGHAKSPDAVAALIKLFPARQ